MKTLQGTRNVLLCTVFAASMAGGQGAFAGDAPPEAIGQGSSTSEYWIPATGGARELFVEALRLQRSNPGAAVQKFMKAAQAEKGFHVAWFNAGVAAEAAGDVKQAEAMYREALGVSPSFGPVLINLGRLYDKAGRSGDANQLVADAVKNHGGDVGPHLAAATRALARNDMASAEREARAAVQIDERSVSGMRLMAAIFHAQGRYDIARFTLENALGIEPGNGQVRLELGCTLEKAGDAAQALVEFEKAAKLAPSLALAHEHRGLLLFKSARYPESLEAMERAVALSGKSARVQLHYGNSLRAMKRYNEAIGAYQQALALEPELADAHFNLGILYLDNAVSNVDDVERMQQAVDALSAFKSKKKQEPQVLARADTYLEAAKKRLAKELKRRERESKKQKDKAVTQEQVESSPESAREH